MRTKRIRFLTFQVAPDLFEIACLDAGTAGHGTTLFEAVRCLAENVQAGIEMAGEEGLEFLCKPSPDELEIFNAIKNELPVPRAALKATGYSGKLTGIGELALVAKPTPHIDIGRLEPVGA